MKNLKNLIFDIWLSRNNKNTIITENQFKINKKKHLFGLNNGINIGYIPKK
jgi:hypothetical protein